MALLVREYPNGFGYEWKLTLTQEMWAANMETTSARFLPRTRSFARFGLFVKSWNYLTWLLYSSVHIFNIYHIPTTSVRFCMVSLVEFDFALDMP